MILHVCAYAVTLLYGDIYNTNTLSPYEYSRQGGTHGTHADIELHARRTTYEVRQYLVRVLLLL